MTDTLKILHYSDLHGELPQIPKKFWFTDVTLALTGDICNNYPHQTFTPGIKQGTLFTPTNWQVWNYRKIDTALEAQFQNQWVEEKLIPHLAKCGIDLKNVLIFRGNHDWADFEKYFPNALNVGSKTILYRGIKIGILTGVCPIAGEWNDEITEWTFENRVKALDHDIEILLTHAGPYGIKDGGYGSREIAKAIYGQHSGQIPYFSRLRLHLYGHAHASRGAHRDTIETELGKREVRFYNAAETRFEIDFPVGQ
jgi:Icc-related predicted phosphoesterase